MRVYTDESGAGTLNGDELGLAGRDAVRDPSLAPGEKYTSGPYGRAAWLLTQIRSLAGEEAFWSALRGVLEEHRLRRPSDTDAFLDAFAPALGPEAAAARGARSLPGRSRRSRSTPRPPAGRS